jgi:hypothetical protein
MSEAVRTMASPAATWAIVVTGSILAFFLATAAMVMDLRVAREQRLERKLGLGPELGPAGTQGPRLTNASMWPSMSEALLAAAGVPDAGTEEPPTVPIPALRAQLGYETPDVPVPLPAQRAGESDRAERSFAGPGPQDDEDGQ